MKKYMPQLSAHKQSMLLDVDLGFGKWFPIQMDVIGHLDGIRQRDWLLVKVCKTKTGYYAEILEHHGRKD